MRRRLIPRASHCAGNRKYSVGLPFALGFRLLAYGGLFGAFEESLEAGPRITVEIAVSRNAALFYFITLYLPSLCLVLLVSLPLPLFIACQIQEALVMVNTVSR